ncbi:hypothetical protein FLW53_24295 [Microbispora sp. SCL1-1]|nr:hypothetical protein FLW53_24295 [Microbispora sp. SCL1-1]
MRWPYCEWIAFLSDRPCRCHVSVGAIASYATARDVPRTRVVFCDAVAYDAGYLPVEDVAPARSCRSPHAARSSA